MAVLNVFPEERATADCQQVQAALQYLIEDVNAIASSIEMDNVSVNTSFITSPPGVRPPFSWYEVLISYGNMLGDKSYHKIVMSKTAAGAMQAAQPYIAEAEQVRAQGLADDLAYAQVPELNSIIQGTRQFLLGCP
jgi:hypothetical protein